MSKFSDWTLTKLDQKFGLMQANELASLNDLCHHRLSAEANEVAQLEHLRQNLVLQVDSWNEQELAMQFIGPVFSMLKFSNQAYNIFQERTLTGIVQGEQITGNPDGLIAKGYREPEVPYFCLQEYKKQKDPNGDPAGQCLAAMLVAQTLNPENMPIYGCYIVGRNWFLMALEHKKYAITLQSYNTTNKNDLLELINILKNLKKIIETNLMIN